MRALGEVCRGEERVVARVRQRQDMGNRWERRGRKRMEWKEWEPERGREVQKEVKYICLQFTSSLIRNLGVAFAVCYRPARCVSFA